MLNYTQQQILDAIVNTTLLEDDDYQQLSPSDAIKVLKSIISDEEFNANKLSLNNWNVLDIVTQIRRIMRHECPQNVNQTHFDAKVGYVCYRDFYGKRVVEKKGLLGLTAKNDSTAEPVTKRDVVKYMTDVIEREITYQQRLMKRENEIMKSVGRTSNSNSSPAILTMARDEQQQQFQTTDQLGSNNILYEHQLRHANSEHHLLSPQHYQHMTPVASVGGGQQVQMIVPSPHPQHNAGGAYITSYGLIHGGVPHAYGGVHNDHSDDEDSDDSDESDYDSDEDSDDEHHHHELARHFSADNVLQAHLHHPHEQLHPSASFDEHMMARHHHHPHHRQSQLARVASNQMILAQQQQLPPPQQQQQVVTSAQTPSTLSQPSPVIDNSTISSTMQSLWLSLEALNHFGFQSGELCRYYEEQIEGVLLAAAPVNVDRAMSELDQMATLQQYHHHLNLLDVVFHKFIVSYLQFYCLEHYDTQPFTELLEQLKGMTEETAYTNCIGNLMILCTFIRGICFEQQKLYNNAIPHFKRVLRLDPMFSKAYLHRGKCFYLMKNYDRAKEDFNNAILADSSLSEAYSYRGLCFFSQRKYDKAIEDYDKAIELDENDYRPYAYRGECLGSQKKYRAAVADYGKAIALNNRDAYIFYGRGICFKNMEQYDTAAEDFGHAIELEPERKDAYFARATCYLASGQFNRATVDFTVVTQIDSRDSLAYFYRGMCFYRSEMIDLAITDFKVATQLDPENARAFNYLGCCYSLKKRYEEAILHFERAIDLDGGLALAYFNVARCYYFVRDYRKAIRRYNMAIELDPLHANSFMGRAQVYAKLNKYHKALRDVKIALAKDPNNRVYLRYLEDYSMKFQQSKGWLKKAVSSVKSKLHHTHTEAS